MKLLKHISYIQFLILALLSLIFFIVLDPFIHVGCSLSSSDNLFCRTFDISFITEHFTDFYYGFSFIQRFFLFYLIVFFYSWLKKEKNYFIWKKRYFFSFNIILIFLFSYVYSAIRDPLIHATVNNPRIKTPGWRIDCPNKIIVTPFYEFKKTTSIIYCYDYFAEPGSSPNDNYQKDQLTIFGFETK